MFSSSIIKGGPLRKKGRHFIIEQQPIESVKTKITSQSLPHTIRSAEGSSLSGYHAHKQNEHNKSECDYTMHDLFIPWDLHILFQGHKLLKGMTYLHVH